MTSYGVRQRVACYVTRAVEGRQQLLVFDHRDDDPDDPSGTQAPAGGIRQSEDLVDAAARETEEETGVVDTTYVRRLGFEERGPEDPGGPSETTYVHLVAPSDGADDWEHSVSGGGADRGFVFVCRWEPLPLAFELADGQGRFLDALELPDG